MDGKPPVITVDGHAAVGKSTVARSVAGRLGFSHLNSGRLYRAVARLCLDAGADLGDPDAVLRASAKAVADGDALDALVASEALDGEDVGEAASAVATLPQVRGMLMAPLRSYRRGAGLVADGRDMGTLVFPDATLKVFLSASEQSREARMRARSKSAAPGSRMPPSLERFRARSERDSNRALAPVEPAPDAEVVDTDTLDEGQTVEKVVGLFERAAAGREGGRAPGGARRT